MENFHILQVSYIPMKNANPPRVRIRSQRFKELITIGWNNEPGETINAIQVAQRWLEANGFTIIGEGEGNAEYSYIITSTFEPLRP